MNILYSDFEKYTGKSKISANDSNKQSFVTQEFGKIMKKKYKNFFNYFHECNRVDKTPMSISILILAKQNDYFVF